MLHLRYLMVPGLILVLPPWVERCFFLFFILWGTLCPSKNRFTSAKWLISFCLFVSFSSFSLSPLFLSRESASCQTGTNPQWTSTALTIIQGEELDPHGRCRQRSAFCRITSSRSNDPFDVIAILKYVPRPACLSKSSRLLSVYLSMSHVPLVIAL